MEPSRFLYLVGAVPFLFLGTAHALATPLSQQDRKGLSPRDPALPGAMAQSGLYLTSRTDVWRAWVGFNLSHSLGAVLFGVLVMLTGRTQAVFAMESPVAVPLAISVAAIYFVLGLRYWFRVPTTGIAISLACFTLAWIVRLSGS